MSFKSLNDNLKKIGAPLVSREVWEARMQVMKNKLTNPETMEKLKKGWDRTKTLRKVARIGTPIGAATVVAGILYDQYSKKKKRKERKESGTKHLGKAYGGKVNTYSSPRKTTYKD